MEDLFLTVALASLTTSAVLLPLLLLSTRLQSRYAGRTLYVVWMVLALRLAIPVDLSLPQAAVKVEAPSYTVSLPAREDRTTPIQVFAPLENGTDSQPLAPVTSPDTAAAAVSLTELAAAVWLGGVLWLLLVRGSGYLFTRRALLRFSRPADGELAARAAALGAELGLSKPVAVRLHPGLDSPLTLGVFRPVVLLPGSGGAEGALRHELCHIRRRDLWYKLLLLWVTALHWFNPLVWWMSKVAGRNLEFCCDDDVVRGRDAAFRRQYGELLLTTAETEEGPALSTRFGGSAAQMKVRLQNLFTRKRNSRALMAAVLACVLLVGTLVACESRKEPADPDALLDALEESITYDGQTVSFTLPEGEASWELHIAGRMVTEGMDGMSLHYLDGTDWQPGESYSFELASETAGTLTELTMEVTAGEGERSIDLLSRLALKPVYVDQDHHISLTMPESWRGHYSIAEIGGDTVRFYSDGEVPALLMELWVCWTSEIEGGSDWTLLGDNGTYYVFVHYPEEDGSLLALAEDDPSRVRWETMRADLETMGGGELAFLENSLPVGPVYVNETYAFSLRLPVSWVDRYTVVEREENQQAFLDFYQKDPGNGDGQFFTLCVEKTAENAESPMGGDAVRLGETGEYTVWLWFVTDVRFDVEDEAVAYEYQTMLQDAEELLGPDVFQALGEGSGVYTNETYGFTFTLPESWGTYGAWKELSADRALLYCPALGEEDGAIAELGVWTDLPSDLTGAPYLLDGSRDGCYVYLEFREYRSDGAGEAWEQYRTLYTDLQALPGTWLRETYAPLDAETEAWRTLAKTEQAELERLLAFKDQMPADLSQPRVFSAAELKAAGYEAEEGVAYQFYEIPNAPSSREDYVNQLYNQLEPKLADELYQFTLLGGDAPCLFAEGKMWHRDGWGGSWYSCDWDSFWIVEASEDHLVYTLEGYVDYDFNRRQHWRFTLQRDDVGGGNYLWRYTEYFA
nr:M56 family metallopeptidase [Flavonifractor sp. An135]